MAAATAQEEMFRIDHMDEAQLREWVEANPGRVNERDAGGNTPLYVAVDQIKSLPLVLWLLDEKGANVSGTTSCGLTPLHRAPSLDILTALLDRNADSTILNTTSSSPLMYQSCFGTVESVARLLEDPRVRATVNEQNCRGETVLHFACSKQDETSAISILHLLLQTGSNPALINIHGQTPLAYLRQRNTSHHTAIALLEQYPESKEDAEKASLLVKARRLVVVSRSSVAPSCLQGRVARGQPLPCLLLGCMVLMSVTGGPDEEHEEDEGYKLRVLVAFLLGVGGPQREGMPRDVFRVVLDLLMPSWDPLRRENAAVAPQSVEQG